MVQIFPDIVKGNNTLCNPQKRLLFLRPPVPAQSSPKLNAHVLLHFPGGYTSYDHPLFYSMRGHSCCGLHRFLNDPWLYTSQSHITPLNSLPPTAPWPCGDRHHPTAMNRQLCRLGSRCRCLATTLQPATTSVCLPAWERRRHLFTIPPKDEYSYPPCSGRRPPDLPAWPRLHPG